MKTLLVSRTIEIPEGVTVAAASRVVTVTGTNTKGEKTTLERAFKTVNFNIEHVGARQLKVDMWFGNRKQKACLRTVCSHIQNMITGVTKGFTYKMRFAYAHFPINVIVGKADAALPKTEQQQVIEVRNFLGERKVRKVTIQKGVNVVKSDAVKDELVLVGNDLEKVSSSAAKLHECCLVRNKDIRKFLDGLYVSEKGPSDAIVSVI